MNLTEALRNRRLERQIARHEIDTGLEKKTVTASYLGMSTNQIIPTQRLKIYWSVLGDCIEDRKAFVFRCTDSQEAKRETNQGRQGATEGFQRGTLGIACNEEGAFGK